MRRCGSVSRPISATTARISLSGERASCVRHVAPEASRPIRAAISVRMFSAPTSSASRASSISASVGSLPSEEIAARHARCRRHLPQHHRPGPPRRGRPDGSLRRLASLRPALPLRNLHGQTPTARARRAHPTRHRRNQHPRPHHGMINTSRAAHAAGLLPPLHGASSYEEPDYDYARRLPRGRLAIMIAGTNVWIMMPPMSIGQPGVAWPFVK